MALMALVMSPSGQAINQDYNNKSDSSSLSPIIMTQELGNFFDRNTEKGQVTTLLAQATATQGQYDISKQVENYQDIVSQYGNTFNLLLAQESNALTVRARLSNKLSVPLTSIPTLTQLMPNSSALNGRISPVDINKLQNDLQGLVVQRYEALQLSVNLIKNLDSAARINSPDSDIFSKLLTPNLGGTEDVPDFLRDMVEDELTDDFGVESGKRFIIREKDIISMNYKEDNPAFTEINVTGSELGGLVGDQGFNIGNGIQLASVWAVDYDLWRQYGFKSVQQRHLPFLNNPELQLAPFAMFALNKERSRLITAQVTTRGNEFMQPGEVYYIQERGMLFYSNTISHNFSYGGTFKTTLDLNYGHVPGEYIPTPLDVIGKSIYKGEHFNIGNYRIARTGTTASTIGTNVGTIVFPNNDSTTLTIKEQLFADPKWGNINKNALEDIKGKIVFLSDTTLPSTNSTYQAVTVRIYSDDEALLIAAQYIVSQLCTVIPPAKVVGGDDSKGPDSFTAGSVMKVSLVTDITENTKRGPSSAAMHYAREFAESGWQTPDISDADYNKQNYFTNVGAYIIDVWIEDAIVTNETLLKNTQIANTTNQPNQTFSSITLANMENNYNQLKNANIAKDNKFVVIDQR